MGRMREEGVIVDSQVGLLVDPILRAALQTFIITATLALGLVAAIRYANTALITASVAKVNCKESTFVGGVSPIECRLLHLAI